MMNLFSRRRQCPASEAGCEKIFAKMGSIAGDQRWRPLEEMVQSLLTIRMYVTELTEPVKCNQMLAGLDHINLPGDT
jgi:hypothetical protein